MRAFTLFLVRYTGCSRRNQPALSVYTLIIKCPSKFFQPPSLHCRWHLLSRWLKCCPLPPRSHTGSPLRRSNWTLTAVEEEENPEDCDEEDLEADPEAFEAYIQENEEKEGAEEDDEAQEESDGEVITAEELKEAWAAGWRAKDQVNEKRKGRNFRNPALKSSFGREKPDARKQSTTCSSCGMKGHWKGDPECPKVKNGEDKPFTPKPKSAKGVHFVSVPKAAEERPVHAVAAVESSKNGLKVHEVNFTFMVGGSHKKEKKHRGDGKQITCPQCSRVMDDTARFCSGCGMSMALPTP